MTSKLSSTYYWLRSILADRKREVPTLVMVGDDDYLVSASTAHDIAHAIPHGRAAVIPHAGHLPFVEATEEFEILVSDFIAETCTAGATRAR